MNKLRYILLFLVIMAGTFSGILASEVIIGTGTDASRFPLGSWYGYEYSASIYSAAELGNTNQRINSVAWYATIQDYTTIPTKIYLKQTSSSDLDNDTWSNTLAGATLVYDAIYTDSDTNLWKTFPLDRTFDLTAGNNLLVFVEISFAGGGSGNLTGSGTPYSITENKFKRWLADFAPPVFGDFMPERPNIKLTYSNWAPTIETGFPVVWGAPNGEYPFGTFNNTIPAGAYTTIAAGACHCLGLKQDGSLAAWGVVDGYYNFGQVTDTPTTGTYKAISGGFAHSLALHTDGSLAAWGLNTAGQCNIPAGNDYIAISAGSTHSLALKADGSLIAWGAGLDDIGQVSDTPLEGVYTAISAGSYHNLALKSDGSIVAWGINDGFANGNNYGQVSNVPAGNDFIAISSQETTCLALKADGTLVAWGDNTYGFVSNVPTGNDFIAIASGYMHGLALKTDHSVVAWGLLNIDQSMDFGQVSNTPLTGRFTAIAAGAFNSYAMGPLQSETLPVELSSFTAIPTSEYFVNLQWITQSETNLSGYYIYRNTDESLANAQRVSEIISGTNSSQTTNYAYTDSEVETGNTYYYWLQSVEMDGTMNYHGPISVALTNPNDHNEFPVIPTKTCLMSAYPNPFNPSATIPYQLKTPETVQISIYNTKGQLVKSFINNHAKAGTYSVRFDGLDSNNMALASGIYYCVMHAGKYSSTSKMVLLK